MLVEKRNLFQLPEREENVQLKDWSKLNLDISLPWILLLNSSAIA